MALSQALRDKISNLENVPEKLIKDVEKVQGQILKILEEKLTALKKTKGSIVASSGNYKVSTDILNSLYKEVMTSTDYANIVGEFVGKMDEQMLLNQVLVTEIVGKDFIEGIAKEFVKQQKRLAAETYLSNSAFEQSYTIQIRKLLNQSISRGENFQDFAETLKQLTVGDDKTDGLLSKHAKTTANDLYSITDRGYVEITANENGVEWFRYVGGEVVRTRLFCEQRDGKYFHKKEIADWGNITTWEGRITGTNSSNIFTRLGGYNCRHILQMVSFLSVPKEVIQRNIANGNYKPTADEAEELGLDK